MRIIQQSSEVYVADEAIVRWSGAEVAFLKERVTTSPRGRVRLCAHRSGEDPLHEMLIALAQRTYIRPHKHLGKSESFHIVEGCVDVVVFEDDEKGTVRDVVELGDPRSGRCFFYRLSAPGFHTLLIRTDPLVFHETTNGPFRKGDAIVAPWAPEESDESAGRAYLDGLSARVSQFLAARSP